MLGIRGKRVHIASLALRVEGVERQRGLAAAADARDYDELPAREIHVDILQVVGAGATDFNLVRFHGEEDKNTKFMVNFVKISTYYVALALRLLRSAAWLL